MDWINIHTSTLRSECYLDAPPVMRATWVNLLCYCSSQENGGRIVGAKEFSDRKWQQIAGVTKEEVEMPARLWKFEGADLKIEYYSVEKEKEVQEYRKYGAAGGRKKAANARKNKLAFSQTPTPPASQTPTPPASQTPTPPASQTPTPPSAEEKRREENRREWKGEGTRARGGKEFSEIPNELEFLAGFMADGIPEEFLRAKFAWFQGNAAWLNAHGRAKDWRVLVRSWWASDRAGWSSSGTPVAGGEKNSARPLSVGQRLFAVDQELDELQTTLDAAHALEQPPDPADVARDRELQKTRAELLREGAKP